MTTSPEEQTAKLPRPGQLDQMKRKALLNSVARGTLLTLVSLVLFYLPFQSYSERLVSSFFIRWVDELFIVFMLMLFVSNILLWGKLRKITIQLLFPILLLCVIGLVSGTVNRNNFFVTLNGTFDYVKNLLLIPIFAHFAFSLNSLKRLYFGLRSIALVLCLMGLAQFILFYMGLAFFERGLLTIYDIRFGVPRVYPFFFHPNLFGLYALLFFLIDFSYRRKFRLISLILLLGVIISISRMVWFGLLLSLFLLYLKSNIRKLLGLILILMLLLAMSFPYFALKTVDEYSASGEKYRGYAFHKSLEIWSDYPVLGAGPGMYGGVVSFVFKSPLYELYQFDDHWYRSMRKFFSLDQFWPQILVELGLAGALTFGMLLWTLFRLTKEAYLKTEDLFFKNVLSALSIVPAILFVYLIGSGLNLTAFLVTYCVFLGSVVGAVEHERLTGASSIDQKPIPQSGGKKALHT